MKTFYVTFGQNHPLRDHFVAVEASNETNAREVTHEVLGEKWAFMYSPDNFKSEFFPGGLVGYTIRGI